MLERIEETPAPANLEEWEVLARQRLPRMVYDYYAGGAGDEVAVRANRWAFQRLGLRPRVLVDVSCIDTSIELFGERLAHPVLLQAGEYVREEIEQVREGKHGARSAQQAIAIGLSKARRAGVKLPVPKKSRTSASTRKRASRDLAKGRSRTRTKPAAKRSRATVRALKREGKSAATTRALAGQAREAARKRTAAERSASARKAARTRARNRR
ncbi:MAG: alpha-hydroxy-acid oxidizing protein [Longimicrobiales bacterium]